MLHFYSDERVSSPIFTAFQSPTRAGRFVCLFFLLFWQPARSGGCGVSISIEKNEGVEHSSSPMRALDKTMPIFKIHGCCTFAHRILKSKGKRYSAVAESQKLLPSLPLAVGWQQTVTGNRRLKCRPSTKARLDARDSSAHSYASPPIFRLVQATVAGTNKSVPLEPHSRCFHSLHSCWEKGVGM